MTDKNRLRKLAIICLSFAGLVISSYLTFAHYSSSSVNFCATGSGCDTVTLSSYSSILGLPVSFMGVFGYLFFIILLTVQISKKVKWTLLFLISIAAFAFSLYLTYLEFFVINAVCSFCVISALIITSILILVLMDKNKYFPDCSVKSLVFIGLVIVGVVISGSNFLYSKNQDFSEEQGSGSYQLELAKHLRQVGAVMYGSFKCPHCNSQKELFGDAFKYIPYVECHRQGKNSEASRCFTMGIQNYPTWVINGRYYPGSKSLHHLAIFSKFGK